MNWCHPSTGICLHSSCLSDGYAILFFPTAPTGWFIGTDKKTTVFHDVLRSRNTADTVFYLVIKEIFFLLPFLLRGIVTWAFRCVNKNDTPKLILFLILYQKMYFILKPTFILFIKIVIVRICIIFHWRYAVIFTLNNMWRISSITQFKP